MTQLPTTTRPPLAEVAQDGSTEYDPTPAERGLIKAAARAITANPDGDVVTLQAFLPERTGTALLVVAVPVPLRDANRAGAILTEAVTRVRALSPPPTEEPSE